MPTVAQEHRLDVNRAGTCVREEGKPQRWAVATRAYCAQDGWVLLPQGFRRWADVTPIRWRHGYSEKVPFNIGVWESEEVRETDVVMQPRWAPDVVDGVVAVRALADAGMVMTSAGFRVEKWHVPDQKERKAYGIPEDDPYAGVAEEWYMKECSFVDIPADPNSGKRAASVLTREQLSLLGIEPEGDRHERAFANIQNSLQDLRAAVLAIEARLAQDPGSAGPKEAKSEGSYAREIGRQLERVRLAEKIRNLRG